MRGWEFERLDPDVITGQLPGKVGASDHCLGESPKGSLIGYVKLDGLVDVGSLAPDVESGHVESTDGSGFFNPRFLPSNIDWFQEVDLSLEDTSMRNDTFEVEGERIVGRVDNGSFIDVQD